MQNEEYKANKIEAKEYREKKHQAIYKTIMASLELKKLAQDNSVPIQTELHNQILQATKEYEDGLEVLHVLRANLI